MKKSLFISIVLFLGIFSNVAAQVACPDWQWARGSEGSGEATGGIIAVDKQGNVYTTGYFSGDSLILGSATLSMVANPWGWTGYLAKYSSTGQFLWANTAGGHIGARI